MTLEMPKPSRVSPLFSGPPGRFSARRSVLARVSTKTLALPVLDHGHDVPDGPGGVAVPSPRSHRLRAKASTETPRQ